MVNDFRRYCGDLLFLCGLLIRLTAIIFLIPESYTSRLVPIAQRFMQGEVSLSASLELLNPILPKLLNLLQLVPALPAVFLGDVVGASLHRTGLVYIAVGVTILLFDLLLLMSLRRQLGATYRDSVLHYWISPVVITLWYWCGAIELLSVAVLVILTACFDFSSGEARERNRDLFTWVGFIGVVLAICQGSPTGVAWLVPVVVARQLFAERSAMIQGELWSFIASLTLVLTVPLGQLRFVPQDVWDALPSLNLGAGNGFVILALAVLIFVALAFLLEWHYTAALVRSAPTVVSLKRRTIIGLFGEERKTVGQLGDLLSRVLLNTRTINSQEREFVRYAENAPIWAILKPEDSRAWNQTGYLQRVRDVLENNNSVNAVVLAAPDGDRFSFLNRASLSVYLGEDENRASCATVWISRRNHNGAAKKPEKVALNIESSDLPLLLQIKRILIGYCSLSVSTSHVETRRRSCLTVWGNFSNCNAENAFRFVLKDARTDSSASTLWDVGDSGVIQLVTTLAALKYMNCEVEEVRQEAA